MSTAGETATVAVPSGQAVLEGNLTVPAGARGIVLFAHGSGSSRHSPRNRLVADRLHEAGLATLLIDLLTQQEEDAERGRATCASTSSSWPTASTRRRPGSGTPDVAGAARRATSARAPAPPPRSGGGRRPDAVGAVVSRGGRPDLAAEPLLDRVRAPTLLIVGGDDAPVIDLNRDAQDRMAIGAELEIVPGASHLFEEPGALERVAGLACAWFTRHLAARAR